MMEKQSLKVQKQGMSFDYPLSAIRNKLLFCQDACQCLMLHHSSLKIKQLKLNAFSGKDPGNGVFNINNIQSVANMPSTGHTLMQLEK